jgi:MFS family permease
MANIYGTFSILGFKVYGFTNQENGYMFGIMGLVGAIIQGGFIRYLSKLFSEKTLVVLGMLFMMTGLGLIPFGGNFTGVAIAVGIMYIGTGIIQPTIMSMVSKYSPDGEQGKVLGITQSLASLGRVFGPLWGGFSYDYFGYRFPFLTGALFTFLALIIAIYILNSRHYTVFINAKSIEENV